jgi:hypothetical protein
VADDVKDAFCVMTTIQAPTHAARELAMRLAPQDIPLIVLGDRKGPAKFNLPNAQFIPLERQNDFAFALPPLLPTGHYVRKNVGYLLAISRGARAIYETDDDNAPNAAWTRKALATRARPVRPARHNGWVNVYRFFTGANVWPRGLPLRFARDEAPYDVGPATDVESPIQQLLSDDAPDVDAVWRLTVGQEPFRFDPTKVESVRLAPGGWCPFNSQATWWFPPAFPLMYLPSTCTFRMTDIWRSLVAQRCLWELGQGVTFHRPEVDQARNPHDLMRDFADEVPGYLKNESIAETLSNVTLTRGDENVAGNLVRCYEALVAAGVFERREMEMVRAWVTDVRAKPRA